MKRKGHISLITGFLLCVFVLGYTTAFAANNTAVQPKQSYTTNGSRVTVLEEEAIIINGHTMVPVRSIAEAMGWSVHANQYAIYLQKHGTIELIPGWLYYTYYKSDIGLTDDNPFIRRNDTLGGIDTYHFNFGHYPTESREVCPGEKPCWELNAVSELVTKPVLKNGRMFVAIGDLAEALYADIEWDASSRTITVTSLLPYYDGDGLPASYRESLLQKTLAEYSDAIAVPSSQPMPITAMPIQLNTPETSSFDLSAFEAEVFRLTNEARKQEGLQPLTATPELDKAVRTRANELLVTYSHTRPDGTRASTAFKGLPYSFASENIAYNLVGMKAEGTAAAFVSIWMGSTGHRASILDPKSRYMGVAASLGPNDRIYCAQVFMK